MSASSGKVLDAIITGSAPDEVTVAAARLIAQLEDLYEPIMKEADGMLVDIPADPVAEGFGAFVARLSDLRNKSNRVARWLQEAAAERRQAQVRVKSAKVAYEEKLQMTLAHDPEVQETAGQQAKLAVAKSKLGREHRLVAYSDRIYTQCVGYHESLKLIHDTLADTKRDMMAQLAVVKQQIAIGEVDGARFPAERRGELEREGSMRQLESAIAAELDGKEGTITF